jgi:hypothetical protein
LDEFDLFAGDDDASAAADIMQHSLIDTQHRVGVMHINQAACT